MVELWPIAAGAAIFSAVFPATILALRKDKIGLRRFFTALGLGLSLGFSCLLVTVWVVAFLSGGRASITVNGHGEAYIEAIALAMSLPVIAYGTLRVLADQVRSFDGLPDTTSPGGPGGRESPQRSRRLLRRPTR